MRPALKTAARRAGAPNATRSLAAAVTGTPPTANAKPQFKSWVPHDDTVLMDTTRQAMVYNLSRVQNAVAEGLVPWFTNQLPPSYFRQVNAADQMRHMRALSAQFDPKSNDFIRAGKARVVLQSITDNGNLEVTYMDFSGADSHGILASQLEELASAGIPGDLSRIKVFSSLDNKLAFNIFTFDQAGKETAGAATAADATHLTAYVEELRKCQEAGEEHSDPGMAYNGSIHGEEALAAHVSRCKSTYVKHTGPRSFLQQMDLFQKVAGTEDVAMHAEPCNLPVSTAGLLGSSRDHSSEGVTVSPEGYTVQADEGGYWVKLAVSNSVPLSATAKIVNHLHHRQIPVERMHLDHLVVDEGGTDAVTMVRMLVRPPAGGAGEDGAWLHSLERDIKRLKWVDDKTIETAYRKVGQGPDKQEVGIQRAEVVTCLSSILHSLLSKQDVWAFSKSNINNVVTHPRYLRHAVGVADLFLARFDPVAPLPEARYKAWLQTLTDEIEAGVQEDSVAKEVLHRMVEVLDATVRTNLYLDDRYALSVRLSTHVFEPGHFSEPWSPEAAARSAATRARGLAGYAENTPFGVFYVHGRRFNAFHVRFRDIARGGMRLVTPGSVEQLAIESARHFDEAYQLAFAQQMKNKDIPEGGSKCVVLVDTSDLPPGPKAKDLILRKSVKAFTDSMLDLIVDTETTRAGVVDLLGKQELVYLGPDEQVIPQDIEWIVNRAAQRGYPIPAAFMSSKADAGINHKVYGVTSEGVQVFLDVALKEMGMHPATSASGSFTVKMTGGPDGDVAGNMIKILRREYGAGCKVVALCDATGCAEDPEGLDGDELMRLVEAELPISSFDAAKLSGADGAVLHICDPAFHGENVSAAEEALSARNTMHNRVVADAFIPAGGRPSTIHEGNWKAFLRPDTGEPSAKLIVEGANLFLTPGARAAMHAATGIPIVKDSSANKCGVICSSYEIMSSMLLSADEFAAVKPELVSDVVAKLRALGKLEAELLFREFRSLPGSLPDFSARISSAINRVTDAIADDLDAHTGGDYSGLEYLVEEHMPAKLTELGGHRLDRVPKEYIKRAIASTLASRIVYQEGVMFVEQHNAAHLGGLAFDYLDAEKSVAKVIEGLEASEWKGDAADREMAANIVRDGGVRAYIARYGGMSGFAK